MNATADSARPGAGEPRPAAAATIDVDALAGSGAFDLLRDEWERLVDRAGSDNIFMTHLWQHAWWDEFGHDLEFELLAFRDGGRLVGLASTYIDLVGGFPVLRFGGGLEVTDYLGLLIEPGYEKPVGRAFLERCLTHPGLVLDLHFLRSDGITLRALTAAAADLDRRFSVEAEEVSPRIVLPGPWDEYLARLRKKDRHELRRKRRRLEEAGGWTVGETSADTLDRDLETFFDLHSKSTRAKADFLTDDVKRFFRHTCAHLQERAWLSLRTLVFEGKPLASVLGFVYRGKLLLYNSGYDPEYNRLGPGFVLMSEEIRLAIEAGLTEVDFLRGDEKYKYDLGAEDLPLVHLTVELA